MKTHAFFAAMGGFAFDISNANVPFFPRGRQYLPLTPRGVEFLLEHQPSLLRSLTQAGIEDKSKSDQIAKFIVIAQASWFIVQTLQRIIGNLTISLLDLNICGHCFCALLVYWCWRDKPLIQRTTAGID